MTTRVDLALAVTERPATGLDDGFFRQVFVADRLPEFLVALPPDQARAMTEDQFRLQTVGYAQQFPHASRRVVLWKGQPVGRVITADESNQVRLVDLVLLPDHRGRGIGTEIVERVLATAKRSGKRVVLSAVIGSRAVVLYESLGFRTFEVRGDRFEMVSAP